MMKTSVVTVTPELAKRWLKKNTNNRRMRPLSVEKIAADIKAGGWIENHQAIAFNCDGTLIDGQHRLAAIVEAGVSIRSVVIRGVKKEALGVIDDHAKRSLCDAIRLVDGESISNRAASTVLTMKNSGRGGCTRVISRSEALAFYRKHRKAILSAEAMFNTARPGLCRAAVLAVVARAWYTANRDDLARFCGVLMDGTPLTKRERVVVKLRDFLTRSFASRLGGGGVGMMLAYQKTERALKAFLANEELRKLTALADEAFPIPGEETA